MTSQAEARQSTNLRPPEAAGLWETTRLGIPQNGDAAVGRADEDTQMLEETTWFQAQVRLTGSREFQTVGFAADRATASRQAGDAWRAIRACDRAEARLIKTTWRMLPTLTAPALA